MTPPRTRRRRAPELALACCLSTLGLSIAVLRALKNPASRLSRFIDRNILPDGVTW